MTSRVKDSPWRRTQPAASETAWMWAAVAIVGLAGLCALATLAASLAGADVGNPANYLLMVIFGKKDWPAAATLILLGAVIVLFCAAFGIWMWFGLRKSTKKPQTRPGSAWVERKAASMARPEDMAALLPTGASRDAERLGCAAAGQGMPIGRMVRGLQPMASSYEWVGAWIMGPRAGKTSCAVVRQICETDGPVIATSNKRDIVDLTRGVRLRRNGYCWTFDPQDLIGEPADWWWNPLSFVTSTETADELASIFAASASDALEKGDAYFEPEARSHLSTLLFAASTADLPITSVWSWLQDPQDTTPVEILEMSGHSVMAESLTGIAALADGQRDGVIGTCRKLVRWMRNEQLLRWVTPQSSNDPRPQFDPTKFVVSTETLYLISKEGAGTARAITAALAVATMRAGEKVAGHSPTGRVPRPMPVILDEAANVVRWERLPSEYSHMGSKGILLSTFFQSWAQGCSAFGKEGMEMLWSAANVRVVGSGLADSDFLRSWSAIIGDHDMVSKSVSVSPGQSQSLFSTGRTTSTQLHREAIFEVSELAAMPPGYAVLVSAGMPPCLIKLTHWSDTDYGAQVKESSDYFSTLHTAA